ncbi:hypothetical protein DITRI_Ditri03aG0003400 [Diplodiscus trichospermus]
MQKKGWTKKFKIRKERLRKEIEEITEEQKGIREGQRQVRGKFQTIESECEQLRKETRVIIQQSVITQIRIAFMFQILKARENKDFVKASQLTRALRFVFIISLLLHILLFFFFSLNYIHYIL